MPSPDGVRRRSGQWLNQELIVRAPWAVRLLNIEDASWEVGVLSGDIEDASWEVGVLSGDGDGEILIMPISTQCFFGAVM
jgi:hypothetical protein